MFPSIYKYGFAAAKAADSLSGHAPVDIPPEQRGAFSICKEMMERAARGARFVLGENDPRLNAGDVEIFVYLLKMDGDLAGDVVPVQLRLQEIAKIMEKLEAPPSADVGTEELAVVTRFLDEFSNSLLETLRGGEDGD
jgi:hypothetical protein